MFFLRSASFEFVYSIGAFILFLVCIVIEQPVTKAIAITLIVTEVLPAFEEALIIAFKSLLLKNKKLSDVISFEELKDFLIRRPYLIPFALFIILYILYLLIVFVLSVSFLNLKYVGQWQDGGWANFSNVFFALPVMFAAFKRIFKVFQSKYKTECLLAYIIIYSLRDYLTRIIFAVVVFAFLFGFEKYPDPSLVILGVTSLGLAIYSSYLVHSSKNK